MKAIIIGATSGIGKEIAVRLVGQGWKVALTGRRMERLQVLRQELGEGNVSVARMDVTEPEALEVLDNLIGSFGLPDLFLYVSGVGYQNRELDIEKEVCMVRTNCEGMVKLVDRFIHHVRSHPERYDPQHKAQVAVVSSVAGTAGLGVAPAYSATKSMQSTYISALVQLSRMEKIPVIFTDIRPGFVKTEFLNPEKHYPMTMTPQQAADHILKGLSRRKRIIIFDWRFRVLVFIWRLIPRCIWERIPLVKN